MQELVEMEVLRNYLKLHPALLTCMEEGGAGKIMSSFLGMLRVKCLFHIHRCEPGDKGEDLEQTLRG